MRRFLLLSLLLLLGRCLAAHAADCPNVTNAPAAPQLSWATPPPESGVQYRGYQVQQQMNGGGWEPVASLQGTTLTLPLLPRGSYVWDVLVLRSSPDGAPLPPGHATADPQQRPPCALLINVATELRPKNLRRLDADATAGTPAAAVRFAWDKPASGMTGARYQVLRCDIAAEKTTCLPTSDLPTGHVPWETLTYSDVAADGRHCWTVVGMTAEGARSIPAITSRGTPFVCHPTAEAPPATLPAFPSWRSPD